MFTGLIQALGTLQTQGKDQLILTLKESANPILNDLEIGDSVAVDGICLTVEKILKSGFVATASPERCSGRRWAALIQLLTWLILKPLCGWAAN